VKTIPVLLTYDIHTHAAHSAPEVDRYLQHVLDLHGQMGVKASFFFPAEAARTMKATVRSILQQGHRVGCHGLTHRNETYDSMPPSEQREKLYRATREIEDIIQQRVTFFRAPVFKISGATIRVLEELGYEADLSINSQRLGLASSDVWNVSWMAARRRPYHPDLRYPWRRGGSKVWEIPLSCFLVPFMSNTMLVFGLAFMKAFFRCLTIESKWSGKPLVYMAHPEDLYAERESVASRPLDWRDLIPTRAQGFRFRYRLYERDAKKIAWMCHSFLESMSHEAVARFCTVPGYVTELDGRADRARA
jgi:hypothetical protein